MALLVRCLCERIRPFKAFVKIPVGMPGEMTSTEWEPGSQIYAAIPKEIDGQGVMDATIQVGYIWADEPRVTACAIAIGMDKESVSEAAMRLATLYWQHRADFRFGVPALTVDDCLKRAMSEKVQPVLISDSGDNPTAGGVGDVTYFLSRALEFPTRFYDLCQHTGCRCGRELHESGSRRGGRPGNRWQAGLSQFAAAFYQWHCSIHKST